MSKPIIETNDKIIETEEKIKNLNEKKIFDDKNLIKIDFVFLSEFHLEKGNIISSHYPKILPFDNDFLSGLSGILLPDGSHLNSEDLVIFFIRYKRNFYYCLNLVITLKDKNLKRGAVTMSLCILSKYPYIISGLKVLLKITLDKILQNTNKDPIEYLEKLFKTINLIKINHKVKTDLEVNYFFFF
jgi:hypothetical protein